MAEVTSPPVDLKPITNTRDLSPNSVILTFESNFTSLFSSASASVDRCSFASDTQDHDFLTSQLYQVQISFFNLILVQLCLLLHLISILTHLSQTEGIRRYHHSLVATSFDKGMVCRP